MFAAARAAGFEVWMHTLPPGGHLPVQRHGGELVGLALAGSGKLLVAGGPQRFQSPCTLVIPPDTEFQVVNNGAVALQLVLVFTQAPVVIAAGGR
jgi:quercetin dioxygenase-like cupin family protein